MYVFLKNVHIVVKNEGKIQNFRANADLIRFLIFLFGPLFVKKHFCESFYLLRYMKDLGHRD